MDDMKRAVYMLALEKISSGRERWICLALRKAFIEITGCDPWTLSSEDVAELLPEFYSLYDGKHWYKWGESIRYNNIGKDKVRWGSAWWPHEWKEPRMRILNYICQH